MNTAPSLEAWWAEIRKDPGAYVGNTGPLGLVRAVLGLVEMAAHDFRASRIDVILHGDGRIEVIDNARNWLAGQTVEEMQPHMDRIMLEPRQLGWSYALFQALSSFFIVQVRRYPDLFEAVYSQGEVLRPLRRVGDTVSQGKSIIWKPDSNIFGDGAFARSTLSGLLKRLAYLWPGVRITMEDRRATHILPPQKETFLQQAGLRNYVSDLALIGTPCLDPIRIFTGEKGQRLELVFAYQYADISMIRAYPTGKLFSLHGTPQRALIKALRESLQKYVQAGQPSLLEESAKPSPLKVDQGLIAVLTMDLDDQGAALAEEQPYETQISDKALQKSLFERLLPALNQYWQGHPGDARRVLDRVQG